MLPLMNSQDPMLSGYTQHREMYDFLRDWYYNRHGREPTTQLSILLCDFGCALNEKDNSRRRQDEG